MLIIHLKRFHMLNGRWVKSQRHVNFYLSGLDVFEHIETKPRYVPDAADVIAADGSGEAEGAGDTVGAAEATKGADEGVSESGSCGVEVVANGDGDHSAPSGDDEGKSDESVSDPGAAAVGVAAVGAAAGAAAGAPDTAVPPADASSVTPHIDKLDPHAKFYKDPSCRRIYDLTSMTIHLGIMGGGHYVAYVVTTSTSTVFVCQRRRNVSFLLICCHQPHLVTCS